MNTPAETPSSNAPKARWISKLNQLRSSNQPSDVISSAPTDTEPPPSTRTSDAQSLGRAIRSEITQSMEETGLKADELANRVEKRLEAFNQNLQAEMQRTMAAYRREMQLSFENHRRELKWVAFWQWMATLALIAAYAIRQM